MNHSLTGSGGMRLGGQGDWERGDGALCQMVITEVGLKALLDQLNPLLFGWYAMGLYQNDRQPKRGDDLSRFTPCSFSGYSGTQLLYGWSKAAMFGIRAKKLAILVSWTHDGGPIANDVFGYYVVDRAGALVFAERFCDGPFAMNRKGRTFKITPEFSTKNERER